MPVVLPRARCGHSWLKTRLVIRVIHAVVASAADEGAMRQVEIGIEARQEDVQSTRIIILLVVAGAWIAQGQAAGW